MGLTALNQILTGHIFKGWVWGSSDQGFASMSCGCYFGRRFPDTQIRFWRERRRNEEKTRERGAKEKNLVFGNEEKKVGFLEFYPGGKGGDRDHLCVLSTCSFDSTSSSATNECNLRILRQKKEASGF